MADNRGGYTLGNKDDSKKKQQAGNLMSDIIAAQDKEDGTKVGNSIFYTNADFLQGKHDKYEKSPVVSTDRESAADGMTEPTVLAKKGAICKCRRY
ncbi:hypothetical protein [Candidatus Tisiphia endosymbiont of Nemotelus uliginosus]|uniref:hypothetical protein n=1 Tax=Candidatus Tisiphia endosymbiont of Nemotelus uliginosus TaxID=3077926 RepID=UPI0035C8E565